MSSIPLGQLRKVALRDAWASEASDFTPWLEKAENLKLLGETLDMNLEFEAREKSVGHFRADILCRDIPDGSVVLIENQLEQSDHTHLGQLLTYPRAPDVATLPQRLAHPVLAPVVARLERSAARSPQLRVEWQALWQRDTSPRKGW